MSFRAIAGAFRYRSSVGSPVFSRSSRTRFCLSISLLLVSLSALAAEAVPPSAALLEDGAEAAERPTFSWGAPEYLEPSEIVGPVRCADWRYYAVDGHLTGETPHWPARSHRVILPGEVVRLRAVDDVLHVVWRDLDSGTHEDEFPCQSEAFSELSRYPLGISFLGTLDQPVVDAYVRLLGYYEPDERPDWLVRPWLPGMTVEVVPGDERAQRCFEGYATWVNVSDDPWTHFYLSVCRHRLGASEESLQALESAAERAVGPEKILLASMAQGFAPGTWTEEVFEAGLAEAESLGYQPDRARLCGAARWLGVPLEEAVQVEHPEVAARRALRVHRLCPSALGAYEHLVAVRDLVSEDSACGAPCAVLADVIPRARRARHLVDTGAWGAYRVTMWAAFVAILLPLLVFGTSRSRAARGLRGTNARLAVAGALWLMAVGAAAWYAIVSDKRTGGFAESPPATFGGPTAATGLPWSEPPVSATNADVVTGLGVLGLVILSLAAILGTRRLLSSRSRSVEASHAGMGSPQAGLGARLAGLPGLMDYLLAFVFWGAVLVTVDALYGAITADSFAARWERMCLDFGMTPVVTQQRLPPWSGPVSAGAVVAGSVLLRLRARKSISRGDRP